MAKRTLLKVIREYEPDEERMRELLRLLLREDRPALASERKNPTATVTLDKNAR